MERDDRYAGLKYVEYVRKRQHSRDIFRTLEAGPMFLVQDTKLFVLAV